MTTFGDMIYQLGSVPVGVGGRMIVGDVYFVDSNANAASPDGKKPANAFATLDAAVGACTANNGDYIFMMPNHTENIAGAAGVNVDVAGVSIVGLGHGADRPTLTCTALASTFQVNAAECYLENFIVRGGVTGGTTIAMDIKAAATNCTINKVQFDDNNTATYELKVMISVEDKADYLKIYNCKFFTATGSDATTAAIKTEADECDFLEIVGCYANGDWSDAILDLDAGTILNPLIKDNILHNSDASGIVAKLDTSIIGTLVGNTYICEASIDCVTGLNASYSKECYAANTGNESAMLYPSTVATT